MFLFWKRKKINIVELKSVTLNKSESLYYYREERFDRFGRKILKNKKYFVNTVIKNVPIQGGYGGDLTAKIRYIGIPNIAVYFDVILINVQKDYVSINKTVDLHIKAVIEEGEQCEEYKFELLPVRQQRGELACI